MILIKEENNESIDLAIKFLREGKIISFATDTVYGLAVDATNSKAVEHLYKIKNREENKPIAIFVKDIKTAKKLFKFDNLASKIAAKFLPGALTIILETSDLAGFAKNLNPNNNFLGFRIVDKKFIQNLLEKFDGILAVTSANPSSLAPAIDADEVKKYFSNDDILIIDGKITKHKISSTVVKISDNKLEILRHGAIRDQILLNENY